MVQQLTQTEPEMPQSPTAADQQNYQFGPFALTIERGMLTREGEEIPLRPKSFAVLRLLVENAGKLQSKEQIMAEVWPGVVVTDDSLTQCLIEIRKALGDTSKQMVRTLPRRGYMFDLPVTQPQSATAQPVQATPAATQRPSAITAALALVAVAALMATWWWSRAPNSVAPPTSIAVLPFSDTTASEIRSQNAYLSLAFTDGLRDELSKIAELDVMARSSSVIIAEKPNMGAVEIASELQVGAVIEGTTSHQGGTMFVSAQLVEGASGSVLWSGKFEAKQNEPFTLPRTVAQQLVDYLLPHVARLELNNAVRNSAAQGLMSQARDLEQQIRDQPELDPSQLTQVIELYQQAIQIDPESVQALARLAGALLYQGDIEAARAPLYKALELDADQSVVQETLARYYWARGEPGAKAAWQRAVDLNPSNVDAIAGLAYMVWQHDFDPAQSELLYRRALELDRRSLSRYSDLGHLLANEGKRVDVLALIEQIEQLFNHPSGYRQIAKLYGMIGDLDRAIAWTIRARDEDPFDPTHRWQLAELYASIGDFDTATKLEPQPSMGLLFHMERYEELAALGEQVVQANPQDLLARYLLAFSYNAQGRYEATLSTLAPTKVADTVQRENRQGLDLEIFVTLIDALARANQVTEARELAASYEARFNLTSDDWWTHAQGACVYSVLGDDERSLQSLERTVRSVRLPRLPVLTGSPCFARFADHPRYQNVIDTLRSRQAQLRQRLPNTLREFGASL